MESNKKPKIAVIGLKGLPAFGGASRSMENLISYLINDFDITVYAVNTHTNKEGVYNGYKQIVFKGIKNKNLNTFLYYLKSMVHALFFSNYDLIHMHHAESGFIIPFLKVKYKVISTLHGVYTNDRFEDKFSKFVNNLFKLFQWFTLRYSDCLISVSKYEIEYCRKITKKPISYIPNGINLNEAISKKNIGYKNFLLFAAARIYGLKGADILLKALQEIDYKGKILIIGDLSHDLQYASYIKKLSKYLNVVFIDIIKNKSVLFKFITSAKIFIFPSRLEAMSNMLLEVASLKCPIICSDIPANTDIFDNDEVLFFKNESYDDLAKKIKWALENPEIMLEKSINAAKKVKINYNWENISRKYKNLYDEILKNKKLGQNR